MLNVNVTVVYRGQAGGWAMTERRGRGSVCREERRGRGSVCNGERGGGVAPSVGEG